jgi:hypothetical protein
MMPLNNSSYHAPQVRFDIRAEREECERLFQHPARVLQDRLARLGGGDRTKHPAMPEWKKVFLAELQAEKLLHEARLAELQNEKLLHQARVLAWGKEKQYYYAQIRSALD